MDHVTPYNLIALAYLVLVLLMIYYFFSDSDTGLQNVLNNLKKCCFDWQLTVNVNKTKILTFQNVFTLTPTVFYENKPLKEVKEYNYLGNTIDYKREF